MRVVESVLEGLGVGQTPVFYVFNKLDKIPPADRAAVRARVLADHPNAVVASAVEPRGLVALEEALTRFAREGTRRVVVTLPLSETRALARLYEIGEVIERRYTEDAIEVELRARPEVVDRLRHEGVALRAAS
jgi:GTP-binding protein HflX